MTDKIKKSEHVDTSDPREQRKFGFVMAGAILALAAIRFAIHWLRSGMRPDAPIYLLVIAIVFVVLASARPKTLKPLFIVWMRLALAMNWVVNHVVMTLAFLGIVVLMRSLFIVLRKDPLNRKWDPRAGSYWEDAEEQPDEFARYKNQF